MLATRRLSGAKATPRTRGTWPRRKSSGVPFSIRVVGSRLPHPDRGRPCGREPAAVRAEGDVADDRGVPAQRAHVLERLGVPDVPVGVDARRGEQASVRAVRDRRQIVLVLPFSFPSSLLVAARQTRPSVSWPAVATNRPVRAEDGGRDRAAAVPELARRPAARASRSGRCRPRLPSPRASAAGSKAAEPSGAPCVNDCTLAPSATRKTLATPSRPAVTISVPSSENATSTSCAGARPSRTRGAVPAPDPQRLSRPTLAISAPSGLNATARPSPRGGRRAT